MAASEGAGVQVVLSVAAIVLRLDPEAASTSTSAASEGRAAASTSAASEGRAAASSSAASEGRGASTPEGRAAAVMAHGVTAAAASPEGRTSAAAVVAGIALHVAKARELAPAA